MKFRQFEFNEVDHKNYKRLVTDEDVKNSIIIDENTIISDADNKPLILFFKMNVPEAIKSKIVKLLQETQFTVTTRASGLVTRSRIFGYSPKLKLRKRHTCDTTSLDRESPELTNLIYDIAEQISSIYAENLESTYKGHTDMTSQVLPEYRIRNTPFTSGIINKNNQLAFHVDRGNFEKVYSNMIVFKSKGVSGGHLFCPELNITLKTDDDCLVMFDGQVLLHGVSPIRRLSEDDYRYSIVFYSLKDMWRCKEVCEEVLDANRQVVKNL